MVSQMLDSTKICLIVGQLYWSTTPGQFSESRSSRSWQYFSAASRTLTFALPKIQDTLAVLRISLSPAPNNLSITKISYQKHGTNKFYRWNPEIQSIRPVGKPVSASFFSASPEGDLRAIDSEEGTWQIDLPPVMAANLSQGGLIHFEFDFSDKYFGLRLSDAALELDLTQEDSTNSRLGILSRRLIEAEEESVVLRSEIQRFFASNSWKVTTPFRHIASKMRALGLWKVRPATSLTQTTSNAHHKVYKRTIDVIIPVYLGLEELKDCLESIENANCQVRYELILINDCSPDPAITTYLRLLKSENQAITLVENEMNLGFTATVNRGMSYHPDRDVVLLNSDTKVSNDWLDRLVNHAYRNAKVATVTPLSNNASICGYPKFLGTDELPAGWSPNAIDMIAKSVNDGLNVQIPTGVGFCMLVRRDCLNEIGTFDAETFPGYGEENDFCIRASQKNWIHLLAGDTFVYHKGAVSFKQESSIKKLQALTRLRRLYPSYDPDVQKFIASDPPRFIRHRIDCKRISAANKPTILAIMHNGRGGTERHIKEVAQYFEDKICWLLIKGDAYGATLSWINNSEGFSKHFEWRTEFGALLEFLKSCRIARAHIHHTYGFTSYCQKLINSLEINFDFTIHDFATVCPRVQFVDFTGKYCGQPNEESCNRCLTFLPTEGAANIQTWRDEHKWIFDQAQRVFSPSADASERIKKYFSGLEIICAPHLDQDNPEMLTTPVRSTPIGTNERLRIAVLGALNEAKGADTLELCSMDAIKRNVPLEFHLLGHAYRKLQGRPQSALLTYGQYQEDELQDLLSQVNPHVVWFPAVWPETYCYTLSACVAAGLPAVAPNLGAFKERLQGRHLTWLQPWDQTPEAWNNFFNTVIRTAINQYQDHSCPIQESPEEKPNFNYRSDYLAWAQGTELEQSALPEPVGKKIR